MKKFLTFTLAVASAVAMTACGGDSSKEPGTGDVSTKSVSGIVSGTSNAPTFGGDVIQISGSITNDGVSGTSLDVQPGDSIVADVVTTVVKAGGTVVLKDVDVLHEVQGMISEIDVANGSLIVLGQVVLVDALTELVSENSDDTYSSIAFADLAVDDYLEVSGVRDDSGSVIATRIERKAPDHITNIDEVKVRGQVSSLDDQSQTFLLQNLQIDYSQASLEGELIEGAAVRVEGTMQGDVLLASEVEVGDERHGRVEDDSEIEVQGVVGDLDTIAMTFIVQGYHVDYSGAAVEGVLENNGARVEVSGTVTGISPPSVVATKVEVKHERRAPRDTSDGEAKGPISAIDTTALTFMVGNQAFYADDNTVYELDDQAGTLADLFDGDFVEVKFDSTQTGADGSSYAIKVELEDDHEHGGDDQEGGNNGEMHDGVEVKGLVEAFDAAAFTLTINGVDVVTADTTRYEIDDESATAEEAFAEDRTGWKAEARGIYQDGVLNAERIEFEPPENM